MADYDLDELDEFSSSTALKVQTHSADYKKTPQKATLGTPDELNVLAGVTPGTVTAGKALVVDSSKDLSSLRNLNVTGPINFDHNTGITAFAGGGQGSATALGAQHNEVTTVASDDDSVVLLSAAQGRLQVVHNLGAKALDVFPGVADIINSQTANTALRVPPNVAQAFYGTSAAQYRTDQSLTRCTAGSFTEDGSGTSYVLELPIPANTLVFDIQVRSTVLWNGTSATLKVGDTSDDDGYFVGVNLKATDLLVGEVLSVASSTNWGGKQGAYLVAASGTRSATYYATDDKIIATVTPGAADGSAGRTFVHMLWSTPELMASTNT